MPDEKGGHIVIIKGKKMLNEIATSEKARVVIRGAILVTCLEEAVAMSRVFGDGDDAMPTLH